jgi:DNA adenine methylase
MMVTRPVMRYPGGKYSLAKWVISHFPAHETYVEIYGGAASILMRKQRSRGEVYNDLNGDVVNVFRVLRDPKQAHELRRLLELTPFSKEEYRLAYDPCDDPVESARRMIFRSFAGIGSDSVTRACAGFRGFKNTESGVTAASEWSGYPKTIPAFTERLQGVCIEQRQALNLIALYDRPDTLFYADPPYLKSTRSLQSVRYPFEMDDIDHIHLAYALNTAQGMVILSGYRSEMYQNLYHEWKCIPKSSHAQNGKASVECLWLSPNIQTTLF